jgi:hypothetical protein
MHWLLLIVYLPFRKNKTTLIIIEVLEYLQVLNKTYLIFQNLVTVVSK